MSAKAKVFLSAGGRLGWRGTYYAASAEAKGFLSAIGGSFHVGPAVPTLSGDFGSVRDILA